MGYDFIGSFIYMFPTITGATPNGANSRLWVPGFNGEILGGWAGYETVPTGTGATSAIVVEVGSTDAISWAFSSSDTAKQAKAGTLLTTHTQCMFDTDDVVNLDVTSANESEATLSVWLVVKPR